MTSSPSLSSLIIPSIPSSPRLATAAISHLAAVTQLRLVELGTRMTLHPQASPQLPAHSHLQSCGLPACLGAVGCQTQYGKHKCLIVWDRHYALRAGSYSSTALGQECNKHRRSSNRSARFAVPPERAPELIAGQPNWPLRAQPSASPICSGEIPQGNLATAILPSPHRVCLPQPPARTEVFRRHGLQGAVAPHP